MSSNTILIPTDFSDVCYNAVLYGLEFCRQYKLEAELFHVDTGVERDQKAVSGLKHVVELYVQKFGIGVTFVERKGELFEAISAELSSKNFDFMLMGTPGKSGFQLLMGSSASKVIDTAKIPVIVLQSKRFAPIKNIVWPVSRLSGNGRGVLEIVNKAAFFGATLHMVFRSEGYQTAKIFEKQFGNQVNLVLQNFDEGGFVGTFVEQVLNYCRDNDMDMIATVSTETKMTVFDYRYEQFLFNIELIPVMCIGG